MRERLRREIELLKKKYGTVEYDPDISCVVVKNILLPDGWNSNQTDILIKVPQGYPTTQPDNFFVDSTLRLSNGQMPNRAPQEENIGGRIWRMFSFHVNGEGEWQPDAQVENGHNLLTYIEGVKGRLSEPD